MQILFVGLRRTITARVTYSQNDVGFDLAIIGDDDLGDDGDGEKIFEDLSNSTATLVDVPDW